MIRTIHSIKNIFHNNAGASSFSHLYLHNDAKETSEEEDLQKTNLFVAVSTASTCHVFFYYIDENEKASRNSKLLGIWSSIISLEDVLTIKLISNGNGAPVLMALTQYGKLLISDTLSPNANVCIHPILSDVKMSFLGMNMVELKQTTECQDRLTFVISGSNSLSPPAIAFSNGCDLKDCKSLREMKIETKEIQGLETVTAKLTTMSYFDLSILQPHLRNHLIRLWKNSNSGHDSRSMDSMDSVIVLGYSDGSVYLSFVDHTSKQGSINITHATKIIHMNTPYQRIVSICLTPEDESSRCGIIIVGHLCSFAIIHAHQKDPIFVQNSSSNHVGTVNHAQIVPSRIHNDDGHNVRAKNTKDNVTIIVTFNCGKSSSADFSFCTIKRHKAIKFQETTLRKDIDWIALWRTRANTILIYVTINGLLRIAVTDSLVGVERNSNSTVPFPSESGCKSETRDIRAMIDAIKNLPKSRDNSPENIKINIFEKIQKGTELISGDAPDQSTFVEEEPQNPSCNFLKDTIHLSQSLSNHHLQSANLNDLAVKGYREDFPVVYGGHSQSYSPVNCTDVHGKGEDDYLKVIWNGFNRNTFSSTCLIFNEKDYIRGTREGIFMDGAFSCKPNGLVVSQSEKNRSVMSIQSEIDPVLHINHKSVCTRHFTNQTIELRLLTENDAMFFRNKFRDPYRFPGLKCEITLCPQEENLTTHLKIEGENKDISIAISLLESAAKSALSTSMRNDNDTFEYETRNVRNFLSTEIGKKSVVFLYNKCKQLNLAKSHNQSIVDLHSKVRSLPLFLERQR
jgi:hypothetical protein